MTEADQLRRRQSEILGLADGLANPASAVGGAAVLVRTITRTTYPTVAGRVYAVVPSRVVVTEAEGQTPTFTDAANGDCFYALNLGSAIPPSGTRLVATLTPGGLYAFRYD
jgi:hypothetical protein